MDRNPMLQGQNPVANVGVIPGKAQLDWDLIKESMANAEDPAIAPLCYPGGANSINHDVMPGDMSFGIKCVRNSEVMEGEPNEVGFASLAGQDTGNHTSARAMQAQMYFQGFAATECRVSDPMNDPMSQDPDHGYALIKAGTVSAPNNGPFCLYAGQWLKYRLPPSPITTYQLTGLDTRFDSSGNMDLINHRARGGAPPTQFRPEIVPFDYTDFSTHIDGAYGSMKHNAGGVKFGGSGIANMPFREFFKTDGIVDAFSYSCDQEEAGGYKYGFIGAVLAGIETLAQKGFIDIIGGADAAAIRTAATEQAKRIDQPAKAAISKQVSRLADAIGLWKLKAEEQTTVLEMFANMFFMDLRNDEVTREVKRNFQTGVLGEEPLNKVLQRHNYENDPEINYKKLRVGLSRFTNGAIVGGWFFNTSSIIGRAMGAAAPGDSVPLLAGHFTL